jgi:hypothetical protein
VEIVSQFVRLITGYSSVSFCCTRLSATVRNFLRVLWLSSFRSEVVSLLRGRGRPEMTSPFDSSTPILYEWPVDTFYSSLSIQKLFNFFVLA